MHTSCLYSTTCFLWNLPYLACRHLGDGPKAQDEDALLEGRLLLDGRQISLLEDEWPSKLGGRSTEAVLLSSSTMSGRNMKPWSKFSKLFTCRGK
jgi:hypothetical protein